MKTSRRGLAPSNYLAELAASRSARAPSTSFTAAIINETATAPHPLRPQVSAEAPAPSGAIGLNHPLMPQTPRSAFTLIHPSTQSEALKRSESSSQLSRASLSGRGTPVLEGRVPATATRKRGPSVTPQGGGNKAVAGSDFKANMPMYLSFKTGDIFEVTGEEEEALRVTSLDGRKGLVPSSCVWRVLGEARAVHDYLGDNADDSTTYLSLRTGQVVLLVGMSENGWWEGVSDGSYGFFPSSYVAMLR